MSELKRFDIVGKYADEETVYKFRPDGECYDADEVDKLIAEKDKELANLTEDALNTDKAREKWLQLARKQVMELRHNKYKRCLAMAKWCFTRSNYFFVVGRSEGGRFAEERFRRSNLYSKWHQRWLELANRFKETE